MCIHTYTFKFVNFIICTLLANLSVLQVIMQQSSMRQDLLQFFTSRSVKWMHMPVVCMYCFHMAMDGLYIAMNWLQIAMNSLHIVMNSLHVTMICWHVVRGFLHGLPWVDIWCISSYP